MHTHTCAHTQVLSDAHFKLPVKAFRWYRSCYLQLDLSGFTGMTDLLGSSEVCVYNIYM